MWARIFGFGEAGLRSLSALAGVLTVPVAYGIGAKLCTRRVGVVLAALTACSPLLIWYSQEARSYELLVLLTAVSLLIFAHARAHPRPALLIAWGVASALALATHYYAVLAVIPQAIWLLAGPPTRPRRPDRGRGGDAVRGRADAAGAARTRPGTTTGSPRSRWGCGCAQIVPQFLIGTGIPAHAVLERVAAVIALPARGRARAAPSGDERSGALVAGALAVGGLALNLILIAGGIDDLITRNLIGAVAAGGDRGGRRARRPAGSAARRGGRRWRCAGSASRARSGSTIDRNLQRPDWRPVAAALGAAARRRARGARDPGPALPRRCCRCRCTSPDLAFLRHARRPGRRARRGLDALAAAGRCAGGARPAT